MSNGRNKSGGTLSSVGIWLLVLVVLLPFAQMIWTSQKPRDRVDAAYYHLSQRMPEQEVKRKVKIDPRPLRSATINSVVVSVTCALLCVVFSSLAGYAFAKKQFRGKAVLFDLVLVSMAVPTVVLMMPLFKLTVALHIYDTLLALIFPFCVTGFGILYMRYAISDVPNSIIESGRIDGLSEFSVLFRIVLPSIWPSVATLAVLQFITSWNAFVLPYAVIASQENYTIAVLLGRIMSDFGGLMWNDIMIVVVAALAPIVLVFVIFNRWVLRGATTIADKRPTNG